MWPLLNNNAVGKAFYLGSHGNIVLLKVGSQNVIVETQIDDMLSILSRPEINRFAVSFQAASFF